MIKRFEHGGNIYQPVPDGGPWLDFSANINPLGLPESIRQALAAISTPSFIIRIRTGRRCARP